eukprot:TRINITY_DN4496_c0_g2_i1.p1 TRINITY_DN4496_c0_g2~~TRINITY_DN4496_c0_g2_i1.p1  ORF type:complete len:618 (-),score=98.03 TRINITY_DN4496_c0_g2_i1:219-2072(-)
MFHGRLPAVLLHCLLSSTLLCADRPVADSEVTSLLATPPVTARRGWAPDVASALASLKARLLSATSGSTQAAGDNASTEQEPSASPSPPASNAAVAAAAPGLAADLMPPAPATEGSQLNTVQLRKQYVPIERNGTVVAYKTAYFGKIHVGSPKNEQDFTVVFDTGSAHLVIPGTACHSETCVAHVRYNETKSELSYPVEKDGTALARGAVSSHRATITFGTGKVSGTFVHDRTCLGGSDESDPNGCSMMNIVVARDMSHHPFSSFTFDGILGLGLEPLALGPAWTFFGQMVKQYPTMQPRFSVFLSRSDAGLSTIAFGGHDTSKAASDIHWVPVAKPELGYWQVWVHQIRVGDTVLDDCEDRSCRAILDTGTSLLGAPRQSIKTLHSLLSRDVLLAPEGTGTGEGQVTDQAGDEAAENDCRLREDAAQFIFDLGPDIPSIVLDPEDYFRPRPFNFTMPHKSGNATIAAAAAGGDNATNISSSNTTTADGSDSASEAKPDGWRLTCRSLLLPLDLPAPIGPRTFILGEPVLRKYYTIYDWESRRVGIATADHSNDGVGAGAVGAPEAGSTVSGAPLPVLRSDRQSKKNDAGSGASTERKRRRQRKRRGPLFPERRCQF